MYIVDSLQSTIIVKVNFSIFGGKIKGFAQNLDPKLKGMTIYYNAQN